MSELQRKANAAAARYGKAQAGYSRLGNEIEKLEQKVDAVEQKIVPLQAAVTRRAVTLYRGERGLAAVGGLTAGSDPVEAARNARLVSGASSRDFAEIRVLALSVAGLREQREALASHRQDQRVALDKLQGERHDVEVALSAMVKKRTALRSRVVPRRANRSRRVAGALSVGEIAAAGVDPASITVATDFVCPIRGPLAFTDTFGDPRGGGRRHQGTDLMSPYGSDNVAVVSGTFETHHSGAGGLAVYLHGDDGNVYYYAHLASVVGPDRRVARGEVIGKTGSSGNARGGSPHTHFEYHPGGGQAVNSYPLVKARC